MESQSDIEDVGKVISEFDPTGNTLVGSLIWIGNKTNKNWEDVSLDDLTISKCLDWSWTSVIFDQNLILLELQGITSFNG